MVLYKELVKDIGLKAFGLLSLVMGMIWLFIQELGSSLVTGVLLHYASNGLLSA